MTALNGKILDEALGILGERLQFKGADPVRLVVCGGSALIALNPTSEEMEAAALWCMTHDPSDGFRGILISMFEELGYEDAAKRL
ncbi:hypothetical protein DRQ21_09490 [Candidatus Fermentibacteria bacterium]|nr:MAG: hypothetical protein DRQ21_09490 [Candidatus Fermentibacteria bacterium]